MVAETVAALGGLDIAVNNAGVNKNNAAEDTPEHEWDLTFNVNTKGLFLCCQVPPANVYCSDATVPVLPGAPRWHLLFSMLAYKAWGDQGTRKPSSFGERRQRADTCWRRATGASSTPPAWPRCWSRTRRSR